MTRWPSGNLEGQDGGVRAALRRRARRGSTTRSDVIVVGLLLGSVVTSLLAPQVLANYRDASLSSTPCVHEGHLRTDRNWFGYLANITVAGTGRLTFEFIYPVERCCQNILFYRQDQIAIIGARMNCWQKEYILRPEDDQILRLTPSFSWSGCHTASALPASGDSPAADGGDYGNGNNGRHGRHPTDMYVCKGGRSFTVDESVREPVTWFVAVSNCATLHGLDLDYVMEVHGQIGDCRPLVHDTSPRPRPPTAQPRAAAPTPAVAPEAADLPPRPASTPAKASLTPREAAMTNNVDGEADDVDDGSCVVEGDISTTKNWFGFLTNLTLTREGWFKFFFTYPYDLQTQNILLYDEDDLANLHWEQTCFQKEIIIPSRRVPVRILDLSFRSTWNGCEAQTVLYSDEPINLTCTGEKRFDNDDSYLQLPQQQQQHHTGSSSPAVGHGLRKVFIAVSNCRSNSGLMLHYRLTVYGNTDSQLCNRSHGPTSPTYASRLAAVLLAAAVGVICRRAGGPWR